MQFETKRDSEMKEKMQEKKCQRAFLRTRRAVGKAHWHLKVSSLPFCVIV
jgi:hypothetical protein